jgi:hypothetical protein
MKTERNILCGGLILIGMFILCGNDEATANEVIERIFVSSVFFINAGLIWLANKSNKEVGK